MEVSREKLVVIAVVLMIGGMMGWQAWQTAITPQSVISRSELLSFDFSTGKVKGVIRFYISLTAGGGELDFHSFAQDVQIPYSELVKYGLPAGTNLDATKRLTVGFYPAGNPWVYGAVDKRSIVYSDGDYDNPLNRKWSWYKVSRWVGQNVPYRVVATGENFNYDRTFLAGPLGVKVGDTVDIGGGIKFIQEGFLGTGELPPSTDYGLVWLNGTTVRTVGSELPTSAYQSAGPMGRGPVTLTITNAEGSINGTRIDYGTVMGVSVGEKVDGFTSTRANNAEKGWLGYPDFCYLDIRRTDKLNGKVELAYKGGNDLALASNPDLTLTFRASSDEAWFTPELAAVDVRTNLYARTDLRLPQVIGITNNNFEFELRASAARDWTGANIQEDYLDMTFYNATDTWGEFIGRTKIDRLTSVAPPGFSWVYRSSDVTLMPSTLTLWNTSPLYGDYVPPTYEPAGVGYSATTSVYAVAVQTTGGLGNPTIILDVPAELFDFAVDIPSYGTPEIVDAQVPSVVEIRSGEEIAVGIPVKNLGPSRDTFTGDIIGLPTVVTQVSSPNVFIPKDNTATLYWTLRAGSFTEAWERTVTVTVRAQGSGLTDSATFKLKGSPEAPPPGVGDLLVTVLDARTNTGVDGVVVRVGEITKTTDASGTAEFTNLLEGEYTVMAEKGIESKTVKATVRPNEVNQRTIYFYETWQQQLLSVLPYLIAMIAVVAVVIGIVYVVKKRRK